MTTDPAVEGLLRDTAPQALGALVRRYGNFDACEDAIQEALLAASVQWQNEGPPENPKAWLITVASRRLIDQVRADEARRRREDTVAAQTPADEFEAPGPDAAALADAAVYWSDHDDTLTLLYMCCHPALTPASQVALTLRAVGGLTTAEIAGAFLVPEPTMAQRISRAKAKIKASGAEFSMPPAAERADRHAAVLQVLYLTFNEGYTATSGPDLQRTDLTREAIRVTRAVHALLPEDGEVVGLLALMLLTDARRAARATADGALIPLAEQDRSLWDHQTIAAGVALITDALARFPVGPYQLQAAIAAVHAEAPTADATDWPQIVGLYELLEKIAPNPVVTLNHAVAAAMVNGPATGLAMLERLDDDERLTEHHRLLAVRAHLHEMAGDASAARDGYREAARRTTSLPEQRYLEGRAARLDADPDEGATR